MDLGAGTRNANGGYAAYDPTDKKLFVSSYQRPRTGTSTMSPTPPRPAA